MLFAAAWLLLVAVGLVADLFVGGTSAHAQGTGPASARPSGAVSSVTVTAPPKIGGPPPPAPCAAAKGQRAGNTACAAAALDAAAKLAASRAQGQPVIGVPSADTTSADAAVGLATPAAAAQQPGTPFGKPPGYTPPPPPAPPNGGAFTRVRP